MSIATGLDEQLLAQISISQNSVTQWGSCGPAGHKLDSSAHVPLDKYAIQYVPVYTLPDLVGDLNPP